MRAVRAASAGRDAARPRGRRARGRVDRRAAPVAPARSASPRASRRCSRLIARGRSNKLIARELGIAEKTVKTHVGHVLAKLGVTDRTQAAVIAVRTGLRRQSLRGPRTNYPYEPRPDRIYGDRMPNAIVTGASRGLGLALARVARRRRLAARHRRARAPRSSHAQRALRS